MRNLIDKIKRKIEKHENILIVITVGIIFMCVMGFFYLGQGRGGFVYNEHLDDAAFKVNDREITLREASYYVMVIESNVNGFAIRYNADDPKRYWNIYMNNGKDKSNYLNQQAEEDMRASCIRDGIYYSEATAAGIYLSEKEKSQVMDDAYQQEKLMTGKMYEVTGYTYEDMYRALEKIAVIKKYVNTLMQEGYTEEQLDVGGEYYEQMKSGYEIWENDELWDKISLGSVTIN